MWCELLNQKKEKRQERKERKKIRMVRIPCKPLACQQRRKPEACLCSLHLNFRVQSYASIYCSRTFGNHLFPQSNSKIEWDCLHGQKVEELWEFGFSCKQVEVRCLSLSQISGCTPTFSYLGPPLVIKEGYWGKKKKKKLETGKFPFSNNQNSSAEFLAS